VEGAEGIDYHPKRVGNPYMGHHKAAYSVGGDGAKGRRIGVEKSEVFEF
jgi:hypothetical protein